MSNCDSCNNKSDCSSCPSQDLHIKLNDKSKIKHIIGVVSGKGGVGKSFITASLASKMNKLGFKTAILDGDITGPSIPKLFGITSKASGDGELIYPAFSKEGIKVVSVNMLLETEETPVIWRGVMISNILKQFYSDVLWEDIDFMFVDMPPGTGDIPLTAFQSLPIDGVIIVTSPQELVLMIVKKAYNMAKEMNVPILGIVENMSWIECGDCGSKIELYGKSKVEQLASELSVPVLGQQPIVPDFAAKCDEGNIEQIDNPYLDRAVSLLTSLK